jgi:hypothetical protein
VEIVLEILRPGGPLRNAQDLEFGQDELPHVLGGNHVAEQQADHLPPYDLLPAEAKIPVTGADVEVVFTQQDIEALVVGNRLRVEIGEVYVAS